MAGAPGHCYLCKFKDGMITKNVVVPAPNIFSYVGFKRPPEDVLPPAAKEFVDQEDGAIPGKDALYMPKPWAEKLLQGGVSSFM